MNAMWKRSHDRAIETPPDERGGQQTDFAYSHRATSRLQQQQSSGAVRGESHDPHRGGGTSPNNTKGIALPPAASQPRSLERGGQFRIPEQLPLLRRAREFHEPRRTRPNDHADQQLQGWPLACNEICIQIGEVAPVLMLLGPSEQSLDLRTRRGEAASEDLTETSAP